MPGGNFDAIIRAVMHAFDSDQGVGLMPQLDQPGVNDSRWRRDDAEQVNQPEGSTITNMLDAMGQELPSTGPIPQARPGRMPVPTPRPPRGGETTPYTGPPELQGGGGPPMPETIEEMLKDPYWREQLQHMQNKTNIGG